jgi:hypothetical protein
MEPEGPGVPDAEIPDAEALKEEELKEPEGPGVPDAEESKEPNELKEPERPGVPDAEESKEPKGPRVPHAEALKEAEAVREAFRRFNVVRVSSGTSLLNHRIARV